MYLNDWKDGGFVDMVGDFEDIYITDAEFKATECPYHNEERWRQKVKEMQYALASEKWNNLDILLASYTNEMYSGDAFVLFKRDGKLYEVNGGHCSCYGLEGQWEPAETSKEELDHRVKEGKLGKGGYGGNEFSAELTEILKSL